MRIRVLGSAAGGGFPQWNCNCRHCSGVRSGRPGYTARTQSSIAIAGDAGGWALINASPDLRAQILAAPELQPARAPRDTGIAAVVLMDAQIDHVTGLLMLREAGTPLQLYCTARVHEDLNRHLPLLPVLKHYCAVEWHEIATDGTAFEVSGVEGVSFTAVPLHSKAPPYSPHRAAPAPGDNLGLVATNLRNGQRAFYAPGLGEVDAAVEQAMREAALLLVDGTCWHEDDMARAGVGGKLSRDMGHLPQQGPGGMIEVLSRHAHARRLLIHINNTNPILDEHGAERRELERLGMEVAYDGQWLEL